LSKLVFGFGGFVHSACEPETGFPFQKHQKR